MFSHVPAHVHGCVCCNQYDSVTVMSLVSWFPITFPLPLLAPTLPSLPSPLPSPLLPSPPLPSLQLLRDMEKPMLEYKDTRKQAGREVGRLSVPHHRHLFKPQHTYVTGVHCKELISTTSGYPSYLPLPLPSLPLPALSTFQSWNRTGDSLGSWMLQWSG